MSKHGPISAGPENKGPRGPRRPSLVERADNVYAFGAALRGPRLRDVAAPASALATLAPLGEAAPARPLAPPPTRFGAVSADLLAAGGFIVPRAAPTALAEEFRVVKRQLLAAMEGTAARTILVCSARPGEGKTFCAINLALSLAAEKDVELVLIDADVAKPDIAGTLGLDTDGPGLLDALHDTTLDVEACLIRTDVDRLSVLPAGSARNDATELLASARTRAVLERLRANDPRRILVFDSPPALAASPAGVLAMHAGQAVVVVRADRTGESDLRQALELISACPRPQLLLNGVEFGSRAKGLGSYYGMEP